MLKPPNGATSSRSSGPTTNPSCTPLPYTPPPLMAKVGRKIPKSGAKSRLATERPVSPSSMPLRLHKPICFRDTRPRKPGRARNVSSAPTRSFWVLSPPSLSLSPKLCPYVAQFNPDAPIRDEAYSPRFSRVSGSPIRSCARQHKLVPCAALHTAAQRTSAAVRQQPTRLQQETRDGADRQHRGRQSRRHRT